MSITEALKDVLSKKWYLKPTLHLKSFLFSKFHSALAFHFQWLQSFLQVQTSLLQSSGLEPDNTIHIRNIAIQQWPPYPFLYLLVPESSRKWRWFHNNAIKMREASFIQCPIMLFQSPCYALFFSEDDEWNLEQRKMKIVKTVWHAFKCQNDIIETQESPKWM